MPSQFADLFAAGAAPNLMEQLGETVQRNPLGDTASPASLTGIFTENKPTEADADGNEPIQQATLDLLEAETVNAIDTWTVNSAEWVVDGIGPANDGIRRLSLSTGWRRESVTYHPKPGGGTRTIDVLVAEDTEDIDRRADGVYQVRKRKLRVARHATNGIDNPQIGDYIVLVDDADRKKWNYAGQDAGGETYLLLMFTHDTNAQPELNPDEGF